MTIKIYVNADACPVKQGIYRVAEQRTLKGVALKVLVVSDSKLGWAKPRGGEPTFRYPQPAAARASPRSAHPTIVSAAGSKTGCHFFWPRACERGVTGSSERPFEDWSET